MHIIQMQQTWLGVGTTKWFLDGQQVDAIKGVEMDGFSLNVDGHTLIHKPYQPGEERQLSLSLRRDAPSQHTIGSVMMQDGRARQHTQPTCSITGGADETHR
jgi:hypothetical protein